MTITIPPLSPFPGRGAAPEDYIAQADTTMQELPSRFAAMNAMSAAFNLTAGIGNLGYLPPVPYAAGIAMTVGIQQVQYAGVTYAPILDAMPFTTSGVFEAGRFRVVQGVTGADLAAPSGVQLVGNAADQRQLSATAGSDRVGHGSGTVGDALRTIDGIVNFSTLAPATLPAGDVDAMIVRQGGRNKRIALGTLRTEIASAATGQAILAVAARAAAESARDAALIQAGVYATEAAGRAAVADGVAFKVVGGGSVAAYEYRRVDADHSTLVAAYPSASAVSDVAARTPEISHVPTRFTRLREASVDSSGVVLSGQLVAGGRVGLDPTPTEQQSRFSDLVTAVVDRSSGVVLSGTRRSTGAAVGAQVGGGVRELLAQRFSDLAAAVVDRNTGVVLSGVKKSTGAAVGVGYAENAPVRYPAASIVHIGGLGQSWTQGANPVLTSAQSTGSVMFDSAINPVNLAAFHPLISLAGEQPMGGRGETIAPGLAAQFNAGASANRPLLVSLNGTGGAPIANMVRGTALYENLLLQIAAAQANCLASGEVYQYRCTAFLQGQGDDRFGSTYGYYLREIKRLAGDLDADIRAATGQGAPVPMLVQQVSSWVTGTAPMAAIAQLRASREMPHLISLLGPTYFLDFADLEHPGAHGYRWLGQLFGKALSRMAATGLPWVPLRPESVRRYGDRGIMLTLTQPGGYPLTIDTVAVTDPGQFGFEYVDDAGSASLMVRQIGDASFHLVTSRAMAANPVLRYAYTSAPGVAGGRTTGPRGCIRNTDPTVATCLDADGIPYQLHDWLVHFSEKIA